MPAPTPLLHRNSVDSDYLSTCLCNDPSLLDHLRNHKHGLPSPNLKTTRSPFPSVHGLLSLLAFMAHLFSQSLSSFSSSISSSISSTSSISHSCSHLSETVRIFFLADCMSPLPHSSSCLPYTPGGVTFLPRDKAELDQAGMLSRSSCWRAFLKCCITPLHQLAAINFQNPPICQSMEPGPPGYSQDTGHTEVKIWMQLRAGSRHLHSASGTTWSWSHL